MAPALIETGNHQWIVTSAEVLKPGESETIGKYEIKSTFRGFLRAVRPSGMPEEVDAEEEVPIAQQPHVMIPTASGSVRVTAITGEQAGKWEKKHAKLRATKKPALHIEHSPLASLGKTGKTPVASVEHKVM